MIQWASPCVQSRILFGFSSLLFYFFLAIFSRGYPRTFTIIMAVDLYSGRTCTIA